jgi:hypothetical protein
LLQLLYIRILDQVPACRYLHSGFSIRFLSNRFPYLRPTIASFKAQDNIAPILFPGLGDTSDQHFLLISAAPLRFCPSYISAEAICVSEFWHNLCGTLGTLRLIFPQHQLWHLQHSLSTCSYRCAYASRVRIRSDPAQNSPCPEHPGPHLNFIS